jgi:hypothetical protein
MIEQSVSIGEVTTATHLGEVTTPVEMNVALALLLGYPGSPHYQVNSGQRVEQGSEIAPEIDRLLCDCLVRANQELITAFYGVFGCAENFNSEKADSAPACFDKSYKILDA